jgi:hypothetical protein
VSVCAPHTGGRSPRDRGDVGSPPSITKIRRDFGPDVVWDVHLGKACEAYQPLTTLAKVVKDRSISRHCEEQVLRARVLRDQRRDLNSYNPVPEQTCRTRDDFVDTLCRVLPTPSPQGPSTGMLGVSTEWGPG